MDLCSSQCLRGQNCGRDAEGFVVSDPVQTSVFPVSKWQCTLTPTLSPLSAVRCKMEEEEVAAASVPPS